VGFINGFICKQITLTTEDRIYTYLKNEIHLSDLVNCLGNTHVSLNLDFLKELLRNASGTEHPAIDRSFVENIGGTFNENAKNYNSINTWLQGKSTIPFNKLIKIVALSSFSLNDIENNVISIKCGPRKGEIYPKFPLRIDDKLGGIVGHIMGDGSICEKYNQVFFCNKNRELLDEFRIQIKYIFGIEPRIWAQVPVYGRTSWEKRVYSIREIPENYIGGLFYPRICGLVLHKIFGKFANGRNKIITNEIRNANNSFKKGFLRAMFDDEGSANSSSHMLKMHQDNVQILENLRNMLSEFGINTNPIRTYFKRNKARHTFSITGFKNYYNFNKVIGFSSSKKEMELRTLIKKVEKSKFFKKKFALPIYSE